MLDVTDLAELHADVNRRAAALFALIDDYEQEDAFFAEVDALAAELAEGDADGLFHRACARDSWGHSDLAVPLYREALARGGLTGENRRRAVIQLASSLRNVGEASTGLALLEAERAHGADHLDDALACTTALCLSSRPGARGPVARPGRPGQAPATLQPLHGQLRARATRALRHPSG